MAVMQSLPRDYPDVRPRTVPGPSRTLGGPTTVTLSMDASALVVSVHGRLDRDGASLVRDAVEAAISSGGPDGPIEVDLRGAFETTSDGMSVLVACAALDNHHPMRFRFGGTDAVGGDVPSH